jgi:hypothetical protein
LIKLIILKFFLQNHYIYIKNYGCVKLLFLTIIYIESILKNTITFKLYYFLNIYFFYDLISLNQNFYRSESFFKKKIHQWGTPHLWPTTNLLCIRDVDVTGSFNLVKPKLISELYQTTSDTSVIGADISTDIKSDGWHVFFDFTFSSNKDTWHLGEGGFTGTNGTCLVI